MLCTMLKQKFVNSSFSNNSDYIIPLFKTSNECLKAIVLLSEIYFEIHKKLRWMNEWIEG